MNVLKGTLKVKSLKAYAKDIQTHFPPIFKRKGFSYFAKKKSIQGHFQLSIKKNRNKSWEIWKKLISNVLQNKCYEIIFHMVPT